MKPSSNLAMRRYSVEPRMRKYAKGYVFLSFARKYKKQLLDTGLDAVKLLPKKVVHKASKFLGNKTADTVTNLNNDKIMKLDKNPINVEGITIPPEKRDEILNKLRQLL